MMTDINDLIGNFNGKEWAEKFKIAIEKDVRIIDDLGTLECWFSNAIMAGYDACEKKQRTANQSPIDHPSHYQSNIECIDAIAASLTDDELAGFIKGNVIKYVWREKSKGGIEDLKKARWYLGWYIRRLENGISTPSL